MLKVAQIQFDPQVGRPGKNFEKVVDLLKQTIHAQLVILPELANSGYNFTDRSQALLLAEPVEKRADVLFGDSIPKRYTGKAGMKQHENKRSLK